MITTPFHFILTIQSIIKSSTHYMNNYFEKKNKHTSHQCQDIYLSSVFFQRKVTSLVIFYCKTVEIFSSASLQGYVKQQAQCQSSQSIHFARRQSRVPRPSLPEFLLLPRSHVYIDLVPILCHFHSIHLEPNSMPFCNTNCTLRFPAASE